MPGSPRILESNTHTMSKCYCGSGKTYLDCCHPLISQQELPATAEALMRSRYSAFCAREVEYIISTRHPSTRALDQRQELEQSVSSTQWCSLQVIHHHQQANKAEVEFAAFYRAGAGPGQIHERSRFQKDGEQWYYLDGVHLAPLKLQRNDSCWCGSGKKLKKCCGL